MSDDQPDEGRQSPSVPDAGQDDRKTSESSDAQPDDGQPRDPAGVGGEPTGDDSTGLSGQPNAEDVSADWSDVDDTADSSQHVPHGGDQSGPTPVDSETHIDAGAGAGPQHGGAGVSNHPQETGAGDGRASDGNQAGVASQAGGGAGTGGQRGPGEKFCSNCGSVISEQAVVCPDCGVEQATAPQGAGAQGSGGNGNDPAVAALLSAIGFLFPLATGAGQVYNGQVGKGILFTVIQLINVGLVFLLIGIFTYPVVGIIAIWDAYVNADG